MSNVHSLYIAGTVGPHNNGKFYLSKLEGDTFSKSYDFPKIPGGVVNQQIMCQAIYNGELYVAGGGGAYPYLAKLNNKTNQLSNNLLEGNFDNIPPETDYINAMTIYKEKLYLGCDVGAISYYDGKTFFPSSKFKYNKKLSYLNCMNVHNDELYIGGTWADAQDDSILNLYVAKLESDGVTFNDNFTFTGEVNDTHMLGINSMITYNGELYIGGHSAVGEGFKPLYFSKLGNNNTFESNIIDNTNPVFVTKDQDSNIDSLVAYKERIYLGFWSSAAETGKGPHNQVYYDIKNKTFTKVLFDNSIKEVDIMDMAIYENDLYGVSGGEDISGSEEDYVFKLDSDGTKFNSFGKNVPSDGGIQSIIDYHPDVKHASDGSGGRKKIYKKNSISHDNLKLILGLSVGLGLPILGVIIFLMYKYGLRNKLSN